MADNFNDWILGGKPDAPKPDSKAVPLTEVADNLPVSWLMQLARRFERHDLLPIPQSFTSLRVLWPGGHEQSDCYAFSSAGVLCDMYLASRSVELDSKWDGCTFIWTDRVPDHPEYIQERSSRYSVPEPVLWWAMRQDGGYDAALMIEKNRSRIRFMDIASELRGIDQYLQKLSRARWANKAFQANTRPDQAMRNARQSQARVRPPKPKVKYDF